MIKFIKVTDAITDTSMLVQTESIFKVEEDTTTNLKKIRKISFVDGSPCEYVTEPLSYFENFLCNS